MMKSLESHALVNSGVDLEFLGQALRQNQKTLTAKGAKKGREVREENQIERYLVRGHDPFGQLTGPVESR